MQRSRVPHRFGTNLSQKPQMSKVDNNITFLFPTDLQIYNAQLIENLEQQ
jgi:hypothetical protein